MARRQTWWVATGRRASGATFPPCNQVAVLASEIPDAALTSVRRKYFSDGKGIEYCNRICTALAPHIQLQDKFYALSAAAALIKFVEFTQHVIFAPGTLQLILEGSNRTTMMDAATVRGLELCHGLAGMQSRASLYGVLNRCKTESGARLLRAEILQPPVRPIRRLHRTVAH